MTSYKYFIVPTMEINGMTLPNEIIFTMETGHKCLYFDFDDPKSLRLATELKKPKYNMKTVSDRRIAGLKTTHDKFWQNKVENKLMTVSNNKKH